MSELRFRITPGILPEPLLKRAYFAAWGRVPRPTHVLLDGENLTIRSNSKKSGTVHVLCPHNELGISVASTETLLHREEPYQLLLELSRGSLGRLLRQLFEWQMLGYQHPAVLRNRLIDVSRKFSDTLFSDKPNAEKDLNFFVILEELEQISLESSQTFAEQSIAWRTRRDNRLPVCFGIGLPYFSFDTFYEFNIYAEHLQNAFHTVIPGLSWKELEPEPDIFRWNLLEQRISILSRYGFNIILGPLLSFNPSALPDWILPNIPQPGFLESRATVFVNAAAERFGSTVHSWILADSVNSYQLPELSPLRVIKLIRLLAAQIKSRGVETSILVGINQPWGEYAVEEIPEYEQVQIAESLIGYSEIDAFLLEINWGFDWHSSLPRNPLAVNHLIDQWSFLGKKVYVSLSVPSKLGADDAEIDAAIVPEYRWSEGLQQFWTENLLKTILSKRMVEGVFWTPLLDSAVSKEGIAERKTYPFSGLIDSDRVLKLAFKHFVALRQSIVQ